MLDKDWFTPEGQELQDKVLLLSLSKRLPGQRPDQLQEYALNSLYFDYFSFTKAYNELCAKNLLHILQQKNEAEFDLNGHPVERVFLSPEGEQVVEHFEKNLPAAVRSFLQSVAIRGQKEALTQAYWKNDQLRGVEVHLSQADQNRPVLSININLPNESLARKICENWPEKAGQVYQLLLAELLGSEVKD